MANKQGTVKEIFEVEDKASSKLERIGNAHSNLGNQIDNTQKRSNNLNTAFSTFSKTTGIVTTGIIGLAGTGFGLLANQALGSASALQQNALALEVMLGSKEKSQKLLSDLTKFASATPFNLTDLQGYTKQLVAYNFSAEEIIPTMKTLGNVASGVGKDKLPNLVYALGQVRVAGKLTGQDLMMMVNAGVPLLDELSKSLGVSTTKVREMMGNSQISYKDVENALKNLGGEGGRWGDLMERQSKTVGGMISNMEDFRDKIFRVAGGISDSGEIIEGGLLDVVGDGLTSILSFISANESKITGFFTNVGIVAGGLINIIQGLVFAFAEGDTFNDILGDGLAQLGLGKETILSVMGVLDTFVQTLRNNTDTVKLFVVAMLGFLGLTAIIGVITMIVNAINPVFLVIAGLALAIALLKKAWDDNLGGIRDIILNKVAPVLLNFFEGIKAGFGEMKNTITSLINSPGFQMFISIMGDTIGKIIEGVANTIGMLREKIVLIIGKMQEWYTKLQPLISFMMTIHKIFFLVQAVIIGVLIVALFKLVQVVWTVLAPVLGFIIDLFVKLIDIVVNVVSGIFNFLVPIFTAIFESAKENFEKIFNVVKTVFEFISGIIKVAMDVIQNLIIPVIQIIWFHFQTGFNLIRLAVETAFNFIKDNVIAPVVNWFMENIIPRVQTFIAILIDVFNAIKNPVTNALNTVKTTFETIFNGIKSFIVGVWNGIGSAVKTGINGIISNINTFINGVNSMLQKLDNHGSKIGVNVDFRVGNIPPLAKGINRVPYDGFIAMLHKDEAVVPAKHNPYNPSAQSVDGSIGGGGNGGTINQTLIFNDYEVNYETALSRANFMIKYA